MTRYRTLLPPAPELIRQKEQLGWGALEKIGQRYGTSRQAVHKRIKAYLDKQEQQQQDA